MKRKMKQTNNIPKGYKDSPLGIIPKEWEVKKLGTILDSISTFSFSREQMTDQPQELRYIHYGDIHRNIEKDSVNLTEEKLPFIFDGLIPKEKFEMATFPFLKNGDIILTDASEDYDGVGKSWELLNIDNKKVVAGLHTIALRDKKNSIAIGYGRYIFRNPKTAKSLKKIAQGTKVFSINYNHISKLNILLPPFSEQQKISETLSLWDAAVEKQTQLINNLEVRKQALMRLLLKGEKRIKGFNKNWIEYHLRDFFNERNEAKFNNLPLLSVGQNGIYPQATSDKKDISNEDKSKYKRICVGDIGYNTMRMWQGRSALSQLEGIISPAYTVVVPKKNANPLFFSYLFKLPKVINLFWRNSQGMVDDTLNCKFKDFSQVKISIPSIEEQIVIANILLQADNEIDLAKKKLEMLKAQKKGLMQQLLTWKKRVKIK
jgi:type I restriction enzyme S subunit